jgi:hypothetical protein
MEEKREERKPLRWLLWRSADGLEKYDEVAEDWRPPRKLQRAMTYHQRIGLYSTSEIDGEPTPIVAREYEYMGSEDGVNGAQYFVYQERLPR